MAMLQEDDFLEKGCSLFRVEAEMASDESYVINFSPDSFLFMVRQSDLKNYRIIRSRDAEYPNAVAKFARQGPEKK